MVWSLPTSGKRLPGSSPWGFSPAQSLVQITFQTPGPVLPSPQPIPVSPSLPSQVLDKRTEVELLRTGFFSPKPLSLCSREASYVFQRRAGLATRLCWDTRLPSPLWASAPRTRRPLQGLCAHQHVQEVVQLGFIQLQSLLLARSILRARFEGLGGWCPKFTVIHRGVNVLKQALKLIVQQTASGRAQQVQGTQAGWGSPGGAAWGPLVHQGLGGLAQALDMAEVLQQAGHGGREGGVGAGQQAISHTRGRRGAGHRWQGRLRGHGCLDAPQCVHYQNQVPQVWLALPQAVMELEHRKVKEGTGGGGWGGLGHCREAGIQPPGVHCQGFLLLLLLPLALQTFAQHHLQGGRSQSFVIESQREVQTQALITDVQV
uniref:Uncharacterized protein n=1 Tax=Mustela putorius furo TaxID=9669 RepID=M3Z5Q6_MUSPF